MAADIPRWSLVRTEDDNGELVGYSMEQREGGLWVDFRDHMRVTGPDVVRIPVTEAEAVAMLRVSVMWLQTHAPHRLKEIMK